MQKWMKRTAFTAFFIAPLLAGSSFAQNPRSYSGSSSYSSGRYQAGRGGQNGSGYHYTGAAGSNHANGVYAGRAYLGGGSHYSGAAVGHSYGSGTGHAGYTPSRNYSSGANAFGDHPATGGRYAAGTSGRHMAMRPETQPRMGTDTMRMGGFASSSSTRAPQAQHPMRFRQSRDAGGKKSTSHATRVRTASPPITTKAYNRPVNPGIRSVSHPPGAGSSVNPRP